VICLANVVLVYIGMPEVNNQFISPPSIGNWQLVDGTFRPTLDKSGGNDVLLINMVLSQNLATRRGINIGHIILLHAVAIEFLFDFYRPTVLTYCTRQHSTGLRAN